MGVQLPLPPGRVQDAADAKRWTTTLATYAESSGLNGVRCARRNDGAKKDGSKNYYMVRGLGEQRHHLRTVLPTQLVFDLGDLLPGDPPQGDWNRCRIESDAIAAGCTNLGVPFIMSLSAGKGVHLEVFLPPEGPQSRCRDEGEDYRILIANAIVAEAKRILWPNPDERASHFIVYDPRTVSPREGSRLLTENGERKTPLGPRKVVWHEGYGPAPRLPATREEAYIIAEKRGIVRPTAIPVALDAERHDTRWVEELLGKPCPTGPACMEQMWGVCDGCPLMD